MRKLFILSAIVIAMPCDFINAQVGINTDTPDPSAILEISANAPTGSTTSNKKGFLPPKVSLTGTQDITTIPSPALGLLVYNLSNAGVFPNAVVKDNIYFWNGTSWVKLMNTDEVIEAVKPRVFYIEGSDTQYFSSSQINYPAGTSTPENLVTFSTTPIINTGNIVSFSSATNIFTINVSGIYEVSAFVNYNPRTTVVISPNHNKRAFLNMKVQKLGGGVWQDAIGSRTAWGVDGGELKTAIIMGTPMTLNAGDQIRLIISNPFDSSGTNDHCSAGDCYIGTDVTNGITVSKGLKLKLLDYNL